MGLWIGRHTCMYVFHPLQKYALQWADIASLWCFRLNELAQYYVSAFSLVLAIAIITVVTLLAFARSLVHRNLIGNQLYLLPPGIFDSTEQLTTL